MNYYEIAEKLRAGLAGVGYVNSIYDGDVYDQWNNNEVPYLSACFELEGIETSDNIKSYNIVVYAADRLLEDGSNKAMCWDAAEQAIETALNFATENGKSDNLWIEDMRQYTPFVQKFADNLAGVWCRVQIKTRNVINLCT